MERAERVVDTLEIQRRFQEAGIDGEEREGTSATAWASRCVRLGVDPDFVIPRVRAFRAGQPLPPVASSPRSRSRGSDPVSRVIGRVRELAHHGA